MPACLFIKIAKVGSAEMLWVVHMAVSMSQSYLTSLSWSHCVSTAVLQICSTAVNAVVKTHAYASHIKYNISNFGSN